MTDELIGRMKRPGVGGRLAQAVLDVVAAIPASTEASSVTPRDRAMALAHRASKKAAAISGGAALMPGPAGLLTLLPDIIGVWKVQAQMVADIAAAYGKSATLGKEQMLYCLFRHLFTQGLRDIIVRAGERYLVQRTSLQLFQAIAMKIGVRLSERALGKAMARYLPLVGATGVAAYAYFDTRKVAATAIELFSAEVVSE